MNEKRSPFAWYQGKPHLVVNFDLEPTDDTPPLQTLLHELLQHHDSDDIAILRPLAPAETRLLQNSTEDAEVEAWAQIAVTHEDRLRGRKRRKPR